MEILGIQFLGSLLREYANNYEHPREKLIVLVHWTFLRNSFLIAKDGEKTDIIEWIKNENGSIVIHYVGLNMVIQTEQFFDNESFYIKFTMHFQNEHKLFLQLSIDDYIDGNDGSLKYISEFISEIENQIKEFTRRREEIVNNLTKHWKKTKNGNRLDT